MIEKFLEELIETNQYVPHWIRVRSRLLLENRKHKAEEILKKSYEFFQTDEKIFTKKDKKQIKAEIRHIIRYGLFTYGFSMKTIAEITFCERTTLYNSFKKVDDYMATDEKFAQEVKDYFKFLI